MLTTLFAAGWSSSVARRAHNPKVAGSNPAPATNEKARKHMFPGLRRFRRVAEIGLREPNMYHQVENTGRCNRLRFRVLPRGVRQIPG